MMTSSRQQPTNVSDHWTLTKEIFAACHDLPPAERGPRIVELCRGDHILQREVESLIASFEQSGDFLEAPAAGGADSVGAGSKLGPYQIEARIAAGGMGEVYRARDTRLDRTVAIKILPPAARGDDARGRLEQEGRTISRLKHPNICALYDIGAHGHVDFLVMEFLEGETVADRLLRGPLSGEELIQCALQVAGALEHAHRQGVIHRDLKPSNIMLTESGAKLLDFGIAKLQDLTIAGGSDAPARATTISANFGTVAYMSPEQVNGEPIDARSDLFSFGAVLYEMAIGRRPFPGDDAESVRAAIRETTFVPVAEAGHSVDRRLARIITRSLARLTQERYQTAGEMRRDLQRTKQTPWVARSAAIAAAVLLATVGVLMWSGGATPATTERVRSVAVLPFTPLMPTRDSDQNYIGVALADAVVSELAAVGGVTTRPFSATNRYRAPDRDAASIGREVNADLVVDGAVQRSGDRLQVNVRLVRTADGATVWTDRFDAAWSDVFRVQDAIAEQVTRALSTGLSSDDRRRMMRRRTGNLDAYEDYLKGRYFWGMRTGESLQRARGYFERAIERDASYGPAYAGLADTYTLLGSIFVAALPPNEAAPNALRAASRALELDETLAEAHASFAFATYSFQWNWDLAQRHFDRAIELDPNYATARQWYSLYLSQRGRMDDALAEAQRGLRIEPLSFVGIYAVGLAHYYARRYDLGREYANQLLEVAPEFPHGRRLLALIEMATGHYDAAVTLLERLRQAQPDSSLYAAALAQAYAGSGRRDKANQILSELQAAAKTRYVSPANLALGYIGLGDADAAFAALERGYAEHSQALTFLKADPVYDSLRSDPRFADLLRRVGLDR